MKSTIRLFNAVPVSTNKKQKIPVDIMMSTLRRGFVFSEEIGSEYTSAELVKLVNQVEKEVGLTPEKMNASFHKSWDKIKSSSMSTLVLEQMLHYITTYGFEQLGIYDPDHVYIPFEKLDIPELKEGKIKLTVIKGYTKEELKGKVIKLTQSGIALKESTIKDLVEVVTLTGISEKEISIMKNKEVKLILYDKYGMFPKDPVEFLRYVIYKTTDKSLLIKSKGMIAELKASNNVMALSLFKKYENDYGLKNLSTIFNRFKPIFLAFKSHKQLNHTINKIARLSKKNHIPMKEDYLNNVTAMIKAGVKIEPKILKEELSKVNVFRKVRLAYALKYRTTDADAILYRLRNGKGYATETSFENKTVAKKALDIVIEALAADVSKNVQDKKIYIPENINYALPSTEKQFTGNVPSGTSITVPKDMIFGVHWENLIHKRIDLDLALINVTDGKIGWDSGYKSTNEDILFSGDVTDAPKPKGASELFYIRRQKLGSHIMTINNYTYDSYETDNTVPLKIMVGQEQVSSLKNNYMLNPNNVACVVKSEITEKQKILGLVVTTTNECRFYFAETSIGNSITSADNDYMNNSRKYLFEFYKNMIDLKTLLVKAGAVIVDNNEDCDIDLSYETLEKDSIINLLSI